jgi:hypothetical protein
VDLSQHSDVVAVFGEQMELLLDAFDVLFKLEDIIEQSGESAAQRLRQYAVIEDDTHLSFGIGGAFGDGIAEFAQEAAQGIDTGGAGFFPLLADAVQLLELLLFDGAHGHGPDTLAAVGFEKRLGIDAVGLIASAIGFDVLGGDDGGVVPGRNGLAGPEVRGAAGFDEHGGRRVLGEEL